MRGERERGVLAIADVMQQSSEVDGAQVEGRLEGVVRVVVDVVRHGHDALNVVPAVGRVVVLHVLLDVGRDGLDEGVVFEGIHGGGY